ncbi:hypothetical protein ACGFY0_44070 [Streptomyces chartreusis]|uniref:hypothetical protein n=1 Tax=Streptomyces chartreusis TaxID=1969 RepID=UPI00370F8C35
MIAFVESVLIGTGYLVLGTLMDELGSNVGMATYTAVPLLACLLWFPVLFRGARVTTETQESADQKAS